MATTARAETRNYKAQRRTFRSHCATLGERCWICGQAIDYGAPPNTPDAFELDHYYPVASHPELTEDPGNFRASHSGCNRSRGDAQPDEVLMVGVNSQAW